MTLTEKLDGLHTLFGDMGSVLVAFSGGIDSTLVLKVAHDRLGTRAVGVTAVSPTFPDIELAVARRLSGEIGARHVIVDTDQLEMAEFVRNDASRCYHCKTDLYRLLGRLQGELALDAIVDGTHLGDLKDDRPGLVAAREWGVRSPLAEARCSKEDVRMLARDLGLSNWDKPAAACLSSRIPRGTPITLEKLSRVERAEAELFEEGFKQFRVRDQGDAARIEVERQELPAMLEADRQQRVAAKLKTLGYRVVTIDPEGYRPGGGNTPR
jgi:uncharacterized protein